MLDIAKRLDDIRRRIRKAEAHRGPGPSVGLIGVTKRHPVEAIRTAAAAGLEDFGENYAQELRDKRRWMESGDLRLRWHFIGALQSNKVKMVVGCHLIHTVDRVSLVDAIERRAAVNDHVQDVLVQVNFGGETQKSGAMAEDVADLLRAFDGRTHIRCRGLMTIPPVGSAEATRVYFRSLRALRDELRSEAPPEAELEHLSMGMSADFEVAIEEGATLVRVGTAIFGPRA